MAKRPRSQNSNGRSPRPQTSPFEEALDDGDTPVPETAPRRSGCLRTLGCLGQLFVAGGAIALSAAGGIAIAQIWPRSSATPPAIVQLLDTPNPLAALRDRLPADLPFLPAPEASPEASPEPSPEASPEASPAPLNLPPEGRQALETQLQAIQQQLTNATADADALETRLGMPRTDAPLETRLQAIVRRLNPDLVPSTPADGRDRSDRPVAIVLPSDSLFRDSYSILRPEAGTILDTILAELQSYRGATLRTIAHTDTLGEPTANRELSLRRARAVTQYLAQRLEGQYRWVAVGMGASRPITTGEDDAAQQRNRRIEIQVDPR
ncbi:MAG: OmpA family protein [Cyanobacteria bacterium]|nr:OmpA family protein [Cyanobacteriota bacterium]